jgi:hypothetical protein
MAETVDQAILDYDACALCSVNGWLTWHLGRCPELDREAKAAHPSTYLAGSGEAGRASCPMPPLDASPGPACPKEEQ